MLLDLRPPTMDGSPLEEGQDVSRPCMPLSPVLEMPPEYPDEDTNLVPCSICNRTFNPVSLQRHEKVCEKLQTKKRKLSPSHAFDSTKQRQEGIDTTGGSVSSRDKKSAPIPKAKSRWREKHKEFLKTIRAAKSTSDDENDGDQKNIPSDYIQCIHCERHFGPKAAERHISWCSEQKNRLSRNHTNEDVEAAQRLKTRTKYTPPKPGQSGWRAPKRKDVISSIPPPNVGANITPPGRLISPPPPTNSSRHVSPPPAHLPPQRHWSPPSVNLSRRNTINSLPPGPPRYGGGTSSLGRSAGKQLAAMIQSISDHHPSYGYPAGSGPSTLYGGSISGSSTPNYGQHQYFNRSASLKLPRRRPAGGTRMARHRDLAMDMLASVSVDGTKAKREEPEGDESHDMTRSKEHFRYKHEDKSYDPYSAAELQFQDLLGPSKSGVGLRAGMMMGSTGSLLSLPLSRRYSVERDFSPPKRNSLRGLGSISLCSFGLDSMDLTTREGKLNGDDSSELESLGGSSHGLRSPENELDDLLASPTSEHHPQSTQLFGNDSYNRKSLSRSNSRSRTVSSQSIRLPFDTTGNTDRKVPDGSYSFSKSPSPSYNFDAYRRSTSVEKTPPLYQPSKERSPSPYQLSKEHSPSPYQPLKERSPSPYLPSKEQTSMLFHTFKERSPLAYHSTKEQSSRLYSTSKERSPSPFQTSKNATSPPYPITKERSPSPFQSKGPMSPSYHNSKERSPPYNSSKEPMSPSYHTSKERSPFTYHSSKEQSSSPYQTSKERSPSPFYTSKEQSPTPYNPPKERSPSPFYTSKEQSPTPYNPPKERTPQPYQNSLGSTSDFKKSETPSSSYGNTHSFGWTASEQSGSPQSYSRYFGSKPQSEGNSSSKTTPSYSTTSYESLKALRACLDEDNKSQKTMMHRLDESMQRVSSGSSTDSSLPPLSSPVPPPASTTRAQPINSTSGGSFAMPKFCYECGNKYPILQARFCCQCGAPRVTAND